MGEQIKMPTLKQRQNGWEDKTSEYANKIKNFLEKSWKEFNQNNGLEFSGGGMEIMGTVQQGEVLPSEVRVLYDDNGDIAQVHAVFIAGQGQDLDVYLTMDALEEFMKYNT